MKKNLFFALAAVLLAACSESENPEPLTQNPEPTTVTLTFSPYEMSAMTRAATSIASICTHLDVWITEGTNTTEVHQTSIDASFGTVSVSLNRLKTYTLVAVAHKANGAATLTNNIIAFPDDKVPHSMIYKTTFSPGTTTSLSCLMTRIVGQFVFQIADEVPDDARHMRFNFGEVNNRWNISTNVSTNAAERISTFENFSRTAEGASFTLYIMPGNLTDTDEVDVTVTATYANGDEYESKTFTGVPIKAGYRTTYHGQFFTTEAVEGAFTVEDWTAFDVVEY